LGGFKGWLQHLDSEELRWEQGSVGRLIVRVVRRCGRRAVRRWGDVSTDSGSGARSPAGCQAKMPVWRPACPRPWDHAGSVKAVACQQSAALRCQGATCRSPSEKSSPSSAPKMSGCARSHGSWDGLPRRSPGSCVATPQPVAAGWSIGPRPRSGTPTGVPSARRSPSWLPTSGSGAMCSSGWRARSRGPTARRCGARRSGGSVGGTGAARTAGGRTRGARSRSRTGCRSTSPMMGPCGSPTRPSTRRCTSKVAAPCAVS
jgi:hypothetical protein